MYMLAFMYPHEPGTTFNYDHFIDVHLPLGIGLTEKYLGIKPTHMVVHDGTTGADGTADSARYGAISCCYFDSRDAVDKFATLFSFEEAARRLSEDFANYTPHPPEIIVSRVHRLDGSVMDAFVHKFKTEMS